ncbi:methyl-accepting chemotaxis protein [Stutzerimonas kirkiae]|uniref:Methyl-accepting chemotaxis protein n=1 Tax=Stutzerimonas kirkiae TaxID=2211392 RepID=A0A4Q9RGD4_9GAMM|nr:methyl-accepting chemotaxis protein [Stutzerimonas kirkiae]TBV00133.1 methyl-accepting chemotaxis protein [Stutzerimonas kirkiae]TBV05827.1 methyl-accepting chemotaxis protein [Stutzerimonas kirkiae]
MRSLVGIFIDLGVGKKLLLGFGVVLLLTLAVAATGFYAVTGIIGRAQQVDQLAHVNALMLSARGQERDFALTRNSASAVALRDSLAALQAALQELAGTASVREQADLSAIASAAQEYGRQFERYGALIEQVAGLREHMDQSAQNSRYEFEGIELEMYDAVRALRLEGDRLRGSDPLTVAEAASGLTKNILDLRTFENVYIGNPSQESVDNWNEVHSNVIDVGRNLKRWLNESQSAAMDTALAELETYRKSFDAFRDGREQRVSLEQSLAEHSASVIAALERSEQTATQDMREQRHNAYLLLASIALLAIVIGLFAAISITRTITVPLRRTVQLAQRVAAGDLSQPAPANVRGDELGQLQLAMQGMTDSLRTLIGRIGGGVAQIAASAEQLSAVTAQTSAGVQNQRMETEQTATAIHQMAATVQEVARNAEQASLAARQADDEARQGEAVVRQAIDEIGRLAGEVEQSGRGIEALNAESGRIGGVLEVIRTVAEQTNLLALNAAIEAARAGEQGRGFAVVADEVRALAQRTHESTKEIETLIASLQHLAQQAVEQMGSSRVLTQNTVELSEQAGAALGRITGAVSTIEQMNQQIAAAAEEQGAVAENISESVTRVRDIGERSAEASEQTAGASAELARLGGELQGLVRQFRV